MFIGRKKEIRQIEEGIRSQKGCAYVVYGREGMGKTSLAIQVSRAHSRIYYQARECTLHTQVRLIAAENQIDLTGREKEKDEELLIALFDSIINSNRGTKKQIIIIDEFQRMVDSKGIFFKMVEVMAKKYSALFLLLGSSVNWVENTMIKCTGDSSPVISQIIKLDELSFADAYDFFPNYSTAQMISVYSVLGGVPGFLSLWDAQKSLKENIVGLIMSESGTLSKMTERIMKSELRELASYHTIFVSLAGSGEVVKLNDVYEETKFSRAKISVYLKNLIEMDLVEKVFSYGNYGKENTQKGLYRIKDSFFRFYYTFVFPNLSEITLKGADEVFEEKIKKALEKYDMYGFQKVCTEYIHFMNELKRLPIEVNEGGSWYGKEGKITLLADNEEKQQLVAICKWEDESYTDEDFEKTMSLMAQADADPDYYYLFSKNGFVSSMETKAAAMSNLTLISLEQL